jgi:predicted aspartyl protease
METETVGKVVVAMKIENLFDAATRDQGLLPADQVRSIEVNDALVDTGAYGLLLPKQMVEQLGLRLLRTQPTSTLGGRVVVNVYSAVRFTIMARDGICDVAEIPDEFPPIIGQIPLEMLDLVVDPKRQRVTGNPAHGGAWIMEML